MTRGRRIVVFTVAAALAASLGLQAQAPARADLISVPDLKQWLGYIASDELEGRGNFSEGLALAAAYIADEMEKLGVKPGGDKGTYFQRVAVQGVQNKGTASVTVEVNGRSRTFTLGEGIELPKNMGGARTLTADQIEFVGYGLSLPAAGIDDYKGRSARGKIVVWLGSQGPGSLDLTKFRRALGARSRTATEQEGAIAVIGPDVVRPAGQAQPPSAMQMGGQGVPPEVPDFTTVQRLDAAVTPVISAKDAFFEFLFSGSDVPYATLKAAADKREPLPAVALRGVKITITLAPKYDVVRTQYTRNVVAIVEGTDPTLKNTYVGFGAHYDHVGYAQGGVIEGPTGPRRSASVGRVTPNTIEDRVWNGADDDGSGTVALMALAKAFAQGPKPKRSLIFIWFTGEERGLWGSRFFADHPTVPIDSMVALLNADMIGRNRDDKPEEANVVYLVGSDRISTELHELSEAANKGMPAPLTLDYSYNDPADSESLYTRSDHYSFAVKGIPVIFYTTGSHPDYHANTDGVDKIEWEKMATITRLIYGTAVKVANVDHAPARDNKGPRAISRGR
ncbi:MAG: M28 family peptidase [Vicinamibacterales bacterium]|nr:M28 family peptidase [Vicinamibacterales bacterium]